MLKWKCPLFFRLRLRRCRRSRRRRLLRALPTLAAVDAWWSECHSKWNSSSNLDQTNERQALRESKRARERETERKITAHREGVARKRGERQCERVWAKASAKKKLSSREEKKKTQAKKAEFNSFQLGIVCSLFLARSPSPTLIPSPFLWHTLDATAAAAAAALPMRMPFAGDAQWRLLSLELAKN